MPQRPAIGKQDFEKVRVGNYFYIDKTHFIREWWENGDDVTLITRPRRFGKTLNMSMLECFFSMKYADRGDLFEGLSIWEDIPADSAFDYRKIQGTYPVMALSFAGIKADNYTETKFQIYEQIHRLWEQFSFTDRERIFASTDEYIEKCKRNGETPDIIESEIVMSLNKLSYLLEQHYGKKPLIFLDEYDTPMQEAFVYGYWDEAASLIRNLFNNTFKTNPNLERAILTGITRISKESVFSDLNNLAVVTTTSDNYAACFGFTEKEVFDALDRHGLSDRKESVKFWYDGFTFGSVPDIYNPWSVIYFLAEKKLAPYWANTSGNGLVNKLIREGIPEIKMDMEDLLEGGIIKARIDEQIVFNQLTGNAGAVWSLLLASGYLRVDQCVFDMDDGESDYYMSLTNFEVRTMFRKMVSGWFDDTPMGGNGFVTALLDGNVEEMNAYMNKVALATFSYFDTGNRPSGDTEPERFYHGFVLGLIVDLRDRYQIKSNRESGFGRYDVMLLPKKQELDGIIIEFKVRNAAKEKTLEETVQAALAQIEAKNYDAELAEKGIAQDKIRHYGFAFEGKTVLIG